MAARHTPRDPRTLPFQRRILDDESPLILIEKARQIGVTEYVALKAVRAASADGARVDWWVVSRDETQAKLFIEDCRRWAEFYQLGAAVFGVETIAETTVFVVSFANGRRIRSLSSNPNALAGKRGTVVLDEFALHQNQALLYQVAKPCTTWGGQLIVISTHRGAGSMFAGFCRDVREHGNPMGWSHHRITIHDAVAEGLVDKINAKTGARHTREGYLAQVERECATREMWLQEYCCQPQQAEGQLIPFELILAAETPGIDAEDPRALKGELHLGLDVARKQDLHAHALVEKGPAGMLFLRRLEVLTPDERSWAARDAALDRYLALPGLRRAAIDQTGTGDKFVEDARRRPNGGRVTGIVFTLDAKAEMAELLLQQFERASLRIPRHELLRQHLAAVTIGYTRTGARRYGADHGPDGHADLFWALALAVWSAVVRPPGAFDMAALAGTATAARKAAARPPRFRPRAFR